jgi:serine/threonine protein kinase
MDYRRQKALQQPATELIEVSADESQIGPYRLREQIGQGGMAALYLADYLRGDGFKRTVAIKKVLPHLIENQDFIKMFIREARLAALLQHPNIVQIFDFGKIANTYIIAMEYINGLNLGQVMAHLQQGLPVKMAVFITMQVSLGLYYSHSRKDDETGKPLGIVHRDISPQNILISYEGEVKISDFGISKANTEPSLTQAGVIKGKLAYLSPEQALGQVVDQQADIYAMGLVFYEVLSGTRLYNFDSDIEAIRTIPELEIHPLKQVRDDIPDALNAIVMKCLDKDKNRRYPDAKALFDDLNEMKNNLQMTYDASDLSNFMRTTFQK